MNLVLLKHFCQKTAVLAFASDRDISLLFIQETWLTDANNHTTAVIKSHGFKVHHAHRAEKAGGGVAIIYRPCIALIRVFTTSYESFDRPEESTMYVHIPDWSYG